MLVLLDQSLADAVATSRSHADPAAAAVVIAAEASSRGAHVLHASARTFDELIAFEAVFGPRTTAQLRRALQRSVLRHTLLDSVEWRVLIHADNGQAPLERPANGKIEVALPSAVVAARPSLFDRALFVVENPNDGHFYESLARSILEFDPALKHSFGSVRINFQLVNGGGNTTATVYEHHKTSLDNFCLAVVDSDKKYPAGAEQETAKALQDVDAAPNQKSWNAWQYVIEVRAVENLFPQQLLLGTCRALDPALGTIATVTISQHWGAARWPYLPLKKGIKCFDLCGNSEAARFWRTEVGFTRCPNSTQSACADREDCITVVVSPLGSSLLAKACEHRPIQMKLDPAVDSHVIRAARPLFFRLLSTFCADEPGVQTA
jgi:hypothetical protein